MNRMRITRILLGLASILSIFTGFVTTPVGAQATNANAAQGIEISPALVELNAACGKTYNITLTITNVTASDLVYSSSVDDFRASDESGSPHIIMDNELSLPVTASVKTWVDILPQFTLQAKKSETINVKIIIPADAEPGGHYGVLSFAGKAPELSDNGVGLSASAGVLLLIRVDGVITEKANLAAFYSSQDGKQNWFFETSSKDSPITFVTRIQNEGNIHIKPIGSIEIRDMFGGIVSTIPVNSDKSNVLPSSIRRFESQYNSDWMIGRYTANLTLGYGTTGQAITSTISFWVIPYKLLLVGLLVLMTIIYILSRLIKVYNRHIIAKSKNEDKTKNKKHIKKKD